MEDIIDEIMRLKEERQAIILAHVYQPEEIQEIADFSGDSFALSRKAAATDAKVIVFCGVRFMAETANILSPDKITLLPAADAGCQMFDDTLEAGVRKMKAEHPDALLVSYVNTPASVKAMSDVCCTSSNAAAVVNSLPKDREVLFVPDENLGSFALEKCPDHKVICWHGGCPIGNRGGKSRPPGGTRAYAPGVPQRTPRPRGLRRQYDGHHQIRGEEPGRRIHHRDGAGGAVRTHGALPG